MFYLVFAILIWLGSGRALVLNDPGGLSLVHGVWFCVIACRDICVLHGSESGSGLLGYWVLVWGLYVVAIFTDFVSRFAFCFGILFPRRFGLRLYPECAMLAA